MPNLAPDGTANGSITGSPASTAGAPSNVIDEADDIQYSFRAVNDGTYIMTVIIDLGSEKSINQMGLYHRGALGSEPGTYDAEIEWELSTSNNAVLYTTYDSGTISLDESYLSETSFEEPTSDVSARYVKIVAEVTCNIAAAGASFYYYLNELRVYQGINIAPAGTITGSVTGTPANPVAIIGTPAETADKYTSTNYGFLLSSADGFSLGAYTEEIKIDLGGSKSISDMWLLHAGAVDGNVGDTDYEWSIETSADDITYTEYASGEYTISASGFTRFDEKDGDNSSVQARYVKAKMIVTPSDPAFFGFFDTALYELKEFRVFEGSQFIDIGLRIHSVTIGANDVSTEALRTFVNGETYEIPFDDSSPVKIFAGGAVRGLTIL